MSDVGHEPEMGGNGAANTDHPSNPCYEAIPGLRPEGSPVDPPPGPSKPSKTQSPAINRPPGPVERQVCGPYLQFITTKPDTKTWYGSALVLYKKELEVPKLEFDHPFVEYDKPDILYEDVFGYTAVRHQLSFSIPEGMGDEKIGWKLEGDGVKGGKEEGSFLIAKWDQNWRGGFFSCNGFDETVTEGVVKDFGFDNVWKHMNSIHKSNPLHLMIWGGDQIYIDFIFKDIPFLQRWVEMDWDIKWKHEFSEETSKYCASYSFFTYLETWEREECNDALRSCPALMMWDDHDIFDGAGSYPTELRSSPVMSGLFQTAQKFRLLFQHHTTPKLANTKHGLWGESGQNQICQLGPRVALLLPDGRTERNEHQVHHPKSLDMIFERLARKDVVADTTQHLITVFAVPFSFIRVPVAEAVFEFLKNRAPWVRRLPGVKGTNSIFGLPEFYDDLLDEWTHDKHIAERNSVLVRLQEFAKSRSIRVTFLSGDVHCASFCRFRSDKHVRKRDKLIPATDAKLMYQAIASAIVNQSPSPNACIGYHYVANFWKPVKDTEEGMVSMFERRPEGGKHVRHRKFMPNRNWLYFEMVGADVSGGGGTGGETQYVMKEESEMADASKDKKHHHHFLNRHKKDLSLLDFARNHYAFDKTGYPSTLGPTSKADGTGSDGDPNHKHHHGMFCHHKKSKNYQSSVLQEKVKVEEQNTLMDSSGLRLRMWLESRNKEEKGRQFSSYEVVIPELLVGDKKMH